ncbi:MAG TPA: hypothetical protein VFY81_02275 [Gammaproteobacteria bacterium]|nr:hypothetical protein [Gammaproteobacteria bacterium]
MNPAVVLVACCVFLAGCATTPEGIAKGYWRKDKNKGLVVYSTRLDSRCRSGTKLLNLGAEGLTLTGKRVLRLLAVDNVFMKHAFTSPPGYHFVQAWDAGEYGLTTSGSLLSFEQPAHKEFDVFFHVEPGVIQYLGEFYVEMPDCFSYRVSVQDQFARDAQLLDQRMGKALSAQMVARVVELPKQEAASER